MSQLLTINLSKGPGVSWGFRLQGGKDFAQPLCIQKVTPGSVSAQAGVQSGDAIVRIGAEDALSLRHKEAQDAIIRAGNSFVMQVQRGTITWKPAVTALAQPKQTPEGPVATQTSLAAAGKGLAPTKYNSPIGLYTDENIAEALTAQAEVINPQAAGANKGCLGINFRKFEREIKLRTDSPTYQMLHGDDSAAAPKQRKQLPPPEEEEEKPVFPTPQPGKQVIHNAGSQVSAPAPPMPKPIRSVQAPITNTENISVNKTATLCHMCDRPIVGVFVRIKDKNMHAECFKCNTCGSSLKNVGYYNVNDKLYCDTHAKQAAAANPPAPNLVPVTVKPGAPIPSAAVIAPPKARNGPTKLFPSTYFGVNPTPYKPVSTFTPKAPVQSCPPVGATSANPQAFGAVAGDVDIRSHIPKKDPVVAAPIQRAVVPPAQAAAPPKPSPMFGGNMPMPSSMPGMNPPKPAGIGAVPTKGVPGERTAPKRGRGVMNQAVASRIPVCANCQIQIRGPFVTALGKNWCPDHFCCATTSCRKQLLDVGFVEEQGALHCEDCYERFFAPTCGKCDKRIKGDCLNAVGKQFHPECFCCAYCGKVFGSGAFYLEDGLPYCETDWNDLFTTKCVGCGFPIEAGDRWVEALNNNYHSQCFKCSKCNKNLEGQSFYAKGGKPFCKSHAQRGF